MVNSSSFGSERNGNSQASCIQANSLHNKSQSLSPITASSATHLKNVFTGTADSNQLCKTHAVEPTPSQTDVEGCCKTASYDEESPVASNGLNSMKPDEPKKSLFCSVPLDKVQTVLSKYTSFKYEGSKVKTPRKVLCLYCDRTFANVNLRHKHVERCHSSKQLRRVSLRKNQTILTSTPCIYCDKFRSAEHTLKDLFKHLIDNHFNKYFGCLTCEDRFLNASHLADHNLVVHNLTTAKPKDDKPVLNGVPNADTTALAEEIPTKTARKKQRTKTDNAAKVESVEEEPKKTSNVKNLRNRKLGVKSSRMILKRSKRLQAKLSDTYKKKRTREAHDKKKNDRQEQSFVPKLNEKSLKTTSNFVNPFPEFDHFFQVKKITDHSIDNLKISSLTFDDVFDKAFFNRIKCNIQENLLHHIDGKLFKNEESESRISNFEKHSNIPPETQNLNTENYGCEVSLNAIAPTTMLLSNQFGDDPESQIEYGSKPSKKKTPIKKDEVHYKYFTRRKYQASILEHKENRDLSKLDMWTQYVIKNRQQKVLDDKKSPKEILDYFSGEEYKNIRKREELNRILDRRGPFEDLREEASKKAALEKLNGAFEDDSFAEIGDLLNEILNKVFETAKESCAPSQQSATKMFENASPEIPIYLNLRPTTGAMGDNEIDKSDRIALICSSQETENFELPGNTVRGINEKVELTGEWARSRIYVCAACGLKLQNMKQFLEHKSAAHQYIWVQHYEFVGNQSELYRDLSIPVLGKVGVLENTMQCKVYKRSDARLCTKCGKQCNSLGELHRHILECGGDWTWMLARKKCKYRPFGAKSRRKRRGLVKRIYTQKTEPSEKKVYKKNFDIPRQKPSDADTIKRMLANLPPKRATRKIMCLKDGFNTPRTKKINTTKQSKFKCGKMIHTNAKEQTKIPKTEYKKNNSKNQTANRRSLRSLNKVLTNNSTVIKRRKYNRKMNVEDGDGSKNQVEAMGEAEEATVKESPKRNTKANTSAIANEEKQAKEEVQTKRCSPRIEKRLEFNSAIEKMNIKRFFPVKKKKNFIENDAKNATTKNSKSEPKNGAKPGLRKRKFDQKKTDAGNSDQTKVPRTNSRNGSKSKTNKIVSEPTTKRTDNYTQTDLMNFLERIAPKNSDLDDVPDLEVSQSENDKSLQTDEAYFQKTALNDSTAAVSTTEVIGGDKSKRKFRKPVRGLNDCIAMLTSKLGENFEKSTSGNVFQENFVGDEGYRHETPDFILKVPFSNEHFDLHSKSKESKCSDECIDTDRNKNTNLENAADVVNDNSVCCASVDTNMLHNDLLLQTIEDKVIKERTAVDGDMVFEKNDILHTYFESIIDHQKVEVKDNHQTRMILSIPEVTNDSSIFLESDSNKENYASDSDDEVPLSTFLKDDPYNESLVIISRSDEETENIESDVLDEEADNSKSMNFTVEIEKERSEAEEHESFVNIVEAVNEADQVDIINAIPINDIESVEAVEEENIVISCNIEMPCLEPQILDFRAPASAVDEVIRENNEKVVEVEEALKGDEKNVEESLVKDKSSKKFSLLSKKIVDHFNEENTKENKNEERINLHRKSPRNPKALESLFDDALLEITDNAIIANVIDNKIEENKSKTVENAHQNIDSMEKHLNLELSQELQAEKEQQLLVDSKSEEADAKNKELRRSRRNSKRVTSYNEIDLVDPLLDDVESDKTISRILRETTKDMFPVKRKSRKLLHHKKVTKNGHHAKKLNGDELFDFLKTTPDENSVLTKPTSAFFNNFEEISNDFNDEHFDALEDILEKSMAAIEENLTERATMPTLQKIEESEKLEELITKEKAALKKSKKSKHKHASKKTEDKSIVEISNHVAVSDLENVSNLESVDTSEFSQVELVKNVETERTKVIYCEICDKSFSRVESLTKHKRTLTHISKLSEIEAREAALKAKNDEVSTGPEQDAIQVSTADSGKNMNLLDMLDNIDGEDCKQYPTPFSVAVNNSNLKLADIINDVLNKPMLKKDDSSNFQEIIIQSDSEPQPETRRYKSLAERKSFESEKTATKSVDYFESDISNVATGTILEKQITLLENIIENRSALNYIDELSVSSTNSVNDNECSKQVNINPTCETNKVDVGKANGEESFLKPTQYEEISEDSNLRNYEEQKSRKALNRDEELFLECCSLLKSGSEVSNYSKKSNNLCKELTDLKLKQCEERDWLVNNCLVQKTNTVECYSDNSRIRTPLGDNFSQDDSNSATISSNWGINTYDSLPKHNFGLDNKHLSFEEVFGSNQRKTGIFTGEETMKEVQTVVSSFDHAMSELKENLEHRISTDSDASYENRESRDGKKMKTKGAMKVFEGLKVSIPTEELNMDKILTSKPTNSDDTKTSVRRNSQYRSRHCAKNKQSNMSLSSKIHDVYDFEETQDNSDIFTRPDFRTFRSSNDKSKKGDNLDDSDEDSVDNISFSALSSSASSISELLPTKSRTEQNLTKNKCMIMGRIFKNAVKSRITDEEIRTIPILDNTKLVEDFVLNCPEPIDEKKKQMTEEELNLAFDNLISSKANDAKSPPKLAIDKSERRNNLCKKRAKIKNKKRNHTASDSSDDEFKLQKSARKRARKRNSNSEDSCINLEQELKECIGVASRKSQRKCTSGKQNVLIEYWSSDESSFETRLELQIAQSLDRCPSPEPIVHRPEPTPVAEIEASVDPVETSVEDAGRPVEVQSHRKIRMSPPSCSSNRRKRSAPNPLYHWSSSSEDESRDLIEVRPIRDELEDEEDRPIQHGWIVGDSPKKLVTMLAQAKGKKCDAESVKEYGKKRTNAFS